MNMTRERLAASVLLLALCGCAEPGGDSSAKLRAGAAAGTTREETSMLTVTSPAFEAGAVIPKKHTGEGDDVSPELRWSGAPAGVEEYAVVCDDPDAPSPARPAPEPWVHWVLAGIPGDATGLAEGAPGVGVVGRNSWPVGSPQGARYAGPMPPPGSGSHRYFFKVYALDAELGLAAGATKKDLLAAMEGHVLAAGELMGTYERR